MRIFGSIAAGVMALMAIGAVHAEAPPTEGTISVEAEPGDPLLAAALPTFVDALGQAFAARGFTLIEAGHAGLVADLRLSRSDVGTGTAKASTHGSQVSPGAMSGTGVGISVPMPTGKSRIVALQQTRLDVRIVKRGEQTAVWQGAAITVRPGDTRTGSDAAVAASLARALAAAYPAQPDEAISVP